ncbi:MAG: DUF1192 domain-containing protein [Alphaproteobacteria bacterium]|jgi:uncharacterized small protein (DUF1192 family)
MDEDLAPPKKPAGLVPRVFDTLSIEELTDYIVQLKAEIARTETAIGQKQNDRTSAETVFRK